MTREKTPTGLTDGQLDEVQGGNLIDPWPTRVNGSERPRAILQFDEADGLADPTPGKETS